MYSFLLNQNSDLCLDVISEIKITDEHCLKYFSIIFGLILGGKMCSKVGDFVITFFFHYGVRKSRYFLCNCMQETYYCSTGRDMHKIFGGDIKNKHVRLCCCPL